MRSCGLAFAGWWLFASACYAPHPEAGAPCDPLTGTCPAGQKCVAHAGGFACELSADLIDAAAHDGPPDGVTPLTDARLIDAAVMGDMISIPMGSFMMGCNTALDAACDPDESPYHAVTLSAYEIDATEVTELQYSTCIAASACTTPKNGMSCSFAPTTQPDFPVGCVDWAQANAYCTWAGKRLPTEAEWERAARGSDGRRYPWGETAPDCTLTVLSGCLGGVQAVATHPTGASPYQLQDAAGNVEEWVADWYDAAYYATSPVMNPPGPASGSQRVFRGGSYLNPDTYMRTSNRRYDVPGNVGAGLGFRCAR